jgi:serine/threonine-protein kinase
MAGAAAERRRCAVCGAGFGPGPERFCPLDGGAIVEGDAADPLIGATLGGRYRVRRPLGKGGMGAVYEAEHVGLDKRVAIKVVLDRFATSRDALARFQREARNASKIGHPAIVDVTDLGETDDGRGWFAMEFLDGVDLARALREDGPMAPARAGRIVGQILDGLEAAHRAGILHRDLKPENVFLIRRAGEADVVKIMDFGISRAITPEGDLRLTETGMVVGTPIYMAPEQAMGRADLDHRVDLYAVGVVLYELLAGKPPFTAASYPALVAQHLHETAPPLVGIGPALSRVVATALAKDPADRPRDARTFAEALRAAIADPVGRAHRPIEALAATRASGEGAAVRGPRRALALGALVVVAGGAALWVVRADDAPAPRRAAPAPTRATPPARAPATATTPTPTPAPIAAPDAGPRAPASSRVRRPSRGERPPTTNVGADVKGGSDPTTPTPEPRRPEPPPRADDRKPNPYVD